MPTTMVKVAGNWGREVSVMLSRMKNAVANKAEDRAQLGISGAREAKNFTTHTVLLRHKLECGESGGPDVGISSKEKVEAMIADPKYDVTKPKGGGLAGGNRVFTRAKEILEESAMLHSMSAMARLPGVGAACATAMMRRRTWTGIGLTRFRGGLTLLVGGEHLLDAKIDIASGG
jgi:hypothetical protein